MFDQSVLKALSQISLFSLAGVTFYPWLSKKMSNKNVTWLQGLRWGVVTGISYSVLTYFFNQ